MRFTKAVVITVLLCAAVGAVVCGGLRFRYAERTLRVYAASPLNPQPIQMPGFPTPAATIESWINANQHAQMRAHAWALWAGITAITQQSQGWPVWETWYSDTEVSNGPPAPSANAKLRAVRGLGRATHPFIRLRQFRHSATHGRFLPPLTASGRGEQVVGFNKFNTDYSQFVWNNNYQAPATLWKIQASWPSPTPVGNRVIQPFPAAAISLKPTFQVVRGPGNQGGITVLNYWLGDLTTGPQNSTNPAMPTWDTWRQCVVVNTGPTAPPPNLTCPNGGGKPAGVVKVNEFYHFALTQDEASEICRNAIGQPDIQNCPVKGGDYAILVAMHMTTKEDTNWTWQTFWWNYGQPFPYGPPPTSVRAPFNHYAMCTAYSMTVDPVNSQTGKNVLCYNPYLETGLTGVDGVHSNCMSCHGVAAYGNNPNNGGTPANAPNYPAKFNAPNAYISVSVAADDPVYYNCNTTTDFSWFLADNIAASVQTQPPQPACSNTTAAAVRR